MPTPVRSPRAPLDSPRDGHRSRYGLVVPLLAFLAGIAFSRSMSSAPSSNHNHNDNIDPNVIYRIAAGVDQLVLAQQAAGTNKNAPPPAAPGAAVVAALTGSNTDGGAACPLQHTSKLANPITINKQDVLATSNAAFVPLKQFTEINHEKFLMNPPGVEHYTLWHYLTKNFHTDCRHVVDIGTRYVTSSLALGATGVPVKTFDLPKSRERANAFRGKSEQEWFRQLDQVSNGKVKIEFKNLDLLKIPDAEFSSYMSTWLIILDTFHQPYSVPFEREWLTRLRGMQPKFQGMVLLDDIHLNDEMKKWWKEMQDNASQWGFTMHDLTKVGHATGTGLLDFTGGKVSIV